MAITTITTVITPLTATGSFRPSTRISPTINSPNTKLLATYTKNPHKNNSSPRVSTASISSLTVVLPFPRRATSKTSLTAYPRLAPLLWASLSGARSATTTNTTLSPRRTSTKCMPSSIISTGLPKPAGGGGPTFTEAFSHPTSTFRPRRRNQNSSTSTAK